MSSRPIALRVLLVEDDIDTAQGLGEFLESRDVVLDYACTIATARTLASEDVFDVVVVDIQLPDGNGIDLCRELKSGGMTSPVIFLTARSQLEDKLRGFDAGAVDYVVKPFAPAELLARIRALAHSIPSGFAALLRAGEYELDLRSGLLIGGHVSLQLNATSLVIMRCLMEAWPRTVLREDLSEAIWGERPPASDPLRMHIYDLRQVLVARFGWQIIETVRGVGYRFGCENPNA